jgi:hypothetical protein
MDPYTFEYQGSTIYYHPATVRTKLEARRILSKLYEAYGYLAEGAASVSNADWNNYDEYSSAMSQCKSNADWWVSSNATPEQIRAAFEIFMDEDPALFDLFMTANRATQAPKKTILSTPQTSPT